MSETYSNYSETLTLEKLQEAIDKIRPILPEENILGIVITKHIPNSEIWKRKFENGIYFLINPNYWKKIKNYLLIQEYPTIISHLGGYPIYENDKLGLEIILGTTIEDYMTKIRWSYIKEFDYNIS